MIPHLWAPSVDRRVLHRPDPPAPALAATTVGVLLLVIATVLSIWKPWGRIGRSG
jgi:hypothetical protein